MPGVLDGLKVVCMGHWQVVPMASAMLADWGADVIKIEPLTGEHARELLRDGGRSVAAKIGDVEVSPNFQFRNRNKRSLALDLKKETGRDILYQLIKKADVFMSNYQLSAIKKLKLDYDTLSQLNPRLIYAVVDGYGSKGPDKDLEAFDEVASWARSGMQYLFSEPGSPSVRSPAMMGDSNTSVHVAAGILGALLHREKTGKGQEVECSLYHCALWSLSGPIQAALSGLPGLKKAPRNKTENPLHISYLTRDDRCIQFSMTQSNRYWPDFCRAIEKPELENDPRFNSMGKRRENCEELIRILDKVFASKTIDEWDRLCREHHLVYSRVQTPEEVITDPQALANDFFAELPYAAGQMKLLASPVKFRQNPASVRTPAPELGQHAEEILLDLGYSREDIARLKEQGVIL